MEISGGWHQVRIALEKTLDQLFTLKPESFFEFDSVLSMDEINTLGYVRNFPHLTCLMCSIDEKQLNSISTGATPTSAEHVEPNIKLALLPAACYKVYMGLSGVHLSEASMVGCIARCFRHEDKALDAYRAMNFTMKEFVCLGNADDAKKHLESGFEFIKYLLDHLGIPFSCEIASDPFFDLTSSTATLSKLLPTKREILYQGHAVSSMNFHRNYFGEKFNIFIEDQAVNTSCVAFGIERWISMLKDVFGTPTDALTAIAGISKGANRILPELIL